MSPYVLHPSEPPRPKTWLALMRKLLSDYQCRGPLYIFRSRWEGLKQRAQVLCYGLSKFRKRFYLDGREHRYLCHAYNDAWLCERTVEVPIVMDAVGMAQGKRILEFGNVLNHYYDWPHDVVDKYEVAPGVLNVDIADFRPTKPYDLIVSISTLEHVGWDEDPRDPEKALRAVENLKRCLNPGGRMLLTIPLGYNSYIDQAVMEGKLGASKTLFMKRVSSDNDWIEVDKDAVRGTKFGMPFNHANALAFCLINEPSR